ncbi:YkvA family protein [Capnocytophaga canimorsus]|uniref:Uncharacterized membrane protein ykvA n=1 Tax=Capnocytophaga canimorsus TaxID=28188 RepID=A0A0B7IGZ6_9FLAO
MERSERTKRIYNNFTSKEVSELDLKQAEKKSTNLKEKVEDFRLLLRMFKDGTSGKYSISKSTLAVISGAILYVVSPVDAIPDIFPLIGWTDDIAVVTFVIGKLSSEIQKYKSHLQQK